MADGGMNYKNPEKTLFEQKTGVPFYSIGGPGTTPAPVGEPGMVSPQQVPAFPPPGPLPASPMGMNQQGQAVPVPAPSGAPALPALPGGVPADWWMGKGGGGGVAPAAPPPAPTTFQGPVAPPLPAEGAPARPGFYTNASPWGMGDVLHGGGGMGGGGTPGMWNPESLDATAGALLSHFKQVMTAPRGEYNRAYKQSLIQGMQMISGAMQLPSEAELRKAQATAQMRPTMVAGQPGETIFRQMPTGEMETVTLPGKQAPPDYSTLNQILKGYSDAITAAGPDTALAEQLSAIFEKKVESLTGKGIGREGFMKWREYYKKTTGKDIPDTPEFYIKYMEEVLRKSSGRVPGMWQQ